MDRDFVEVGNWTYEQFASFVADSIQTELEYDLQLLWPICPGHRAHSLSATRIYGYWVCPDDENTRFRIGGLSSTIT